MEYKVIVCIIFLIGIFFLLHFFYLLFLSKQTKEWLPVESIIDTSEMEILNKDIGNDDGISYKANVKYQYMVGKNIYSSKKIFIGDYIIRNFPRSVKILINRYIEGKIVLAYYNPKHPNKSVLEIGVHAAIYRELFVGILFLLLSVIMLVCELPPSVLDLLE